MSDAIETSDAWIETPFKSEDELLSSIWQIRRYGMGGNNEARLKLVCEALRQIISIIEKRREHGDNIK